VDSGQEKKSSSDSSGSVTALIRGAQAGDRQTAPSQLWNRYYQQVCHVVRQVLRGSHEIDGDWEDVALETMRQVLEGVYEDRYPLLNDRDNLWAILARVTVCRALDERKRRQRHQRRLGMVASDATSSSAVEPRERFPVETVVDRAPLPDLVLEATEQIERLMGLLGSHPRLATLARLKLQGATQEQISDELQVSQRTIRRDLARIREIWLADRTAADGQ
jgi:RNA polymerase sigma factor (sigma-70 family)